MNQFVRSLNVDLHNRLDKMITHLNGRTMVTPSSASFKNTAVVEMTQLKKSISDILECGILNEDFFTSNTVIKYNSMNNEFIEFELYLFLPISKYDFAAEGYFEKIMCSIYAEIKTSQSPPFVSTFSNSDSYYWTHSKFKIIAIPQGEEKHLLNIGDLYHEIGHHIIDQSERFLVGNHIDFIQIIIGNLLITKKGRSNLDFRNNIKKGLHYWQNFWSEELACDLIGAYLVGPAYAWSNMKICAVSSGLNKIYSNSDIFRTHPPDEARMRAVLKMLELTGCGSEIQKILEDWNRLLLIAQNEKPDHYDVLFSDELINSIATNVYNGCADLGLQTYLQQKKNNTRPISQIVNEAWETIRNDPQRYPQWENEQIVNLQSRML